MAPPADQPMDGAIVAAVALADHCESLMPYLRRGEFYGSHDGMALGAGLIVTNVLIPIYLPEREAYATGRGTALILTHECDIDPENRRLYSDKALVAPLTPLDKCLSSASEGSEPTMKQLLQSVASGNVQRLFFLPRAGVVGSPLFYGAILDFNYLASCAVAALRHAEVVCSLTGYALTAVDRAIQNHLFRPKADRAPLPH